MSHQNNFDFLRLAAASMVIWGHAYPILDEPAEPSIFGGSINSYALRIFFVLSGYLVVASWVRDPNPLRFCTKRVLRILPALAVVVCFAALILGPLITTLTLFEYIFDISFWAYFKNIFLHINYPLPGVFKDNLFPRAVNGSLWSLPVEVTMYFLVLLTGLVSSIFSGRHFALLWTVLTIIFLVLHFAEFSIGLALVDGVIIYSTPMTASLHLAPYFLVGGCLFLWRDPVPRSSVAAILGLIVGWYISSIGWSVEIALIFITSYAVVTLGNISTPVVRSVGRFGDISYGVYLFGFPVAQTLSWKFGRDISFAAHIFWAVLISYVLAFLSWHIVEKKMLQMKPKPLAGYDL